MVLAIAIAVSFAPSADAPPDALEPIAKVDSQKVEATTTDATAKQAVIETPPAPPVPTTTVLKKDVFLRLYKHI